MSARVTRSSSVSSAAGAAAGSARPTRRPPGQEKTKKTSVDARAPRGDIIGVSDGDSEGGSTPRDGAAAGAAASGAAGRGGAEGVTGDVQRATATREGPQASPQQGRPPSASPGTSPAASPERASRAAAGAAADGAAAAAIDPLALLQALVLQQGEQNAAVLRTLQQTPAGPPTRGAQTRGPEIKLVGVPVYKGESGAALDAWVTQMRRHHKDYVTLGGASEERFVTKASALLTEAADAWWSALEDSDQCPTTWAGMMEGLKLQFQPVASEELAQEALLGLKQGGKTSTMEYATAFRRELARAGPDQFTEKFLVNRFIGGLHRDTTRDWLRGEPPATLQKAIEMATRRDGRGASVGAAAAEAAAASVVDLKAELLAAMDERLKAASGRDGERRGDGGGGRGGKPGGYRTREERGANSGRPLAAWKRIEGMTKEMAYQRMGRDECIQCGEKGHIARMCEKPARLN